MKKIKIYNVLFVLVVISIVVFLFWKFWPSELIKEENKLTERQIELAKSVDERIVKTDNLDNKNIIISSPASGETISSPLNITGQINGGGWSGFEGQAGTVQLLDADGKVLSSAILEAKTDWMRLPTKFQATLEFYSSKQQEGKLIFKNENPSGMPENNREFILSVKISKTL